METDERSNAVTVFGENGVDAVLEQLVNVQTKLALCVEEIPRYIVDPSWDRDIDKIRIGFRCVSEEIQTLLRPLITAKKADAEKIAQLETSYGELYFKWQKEQKKVATAEAEISQLKSLTMHQSNFCSNLGAVLGSFLWRCSKFPQIVNKWLTDDQAKVGEFISIANTTIVSFIDEFSTNFPDMQNDEGQFVMAILGTVTNISSTPIGRQYLISHLHGKDLVAQLVKAMPVIPKPSGDSMKKLMLSVLYNVSLNRDGLPFLLDLKADEMIANCLDETSTQDIQLSALRLLQSITFKLEDFNIFQRLILNLPIEKIESLARSFSEEQISKIAQEVMANLKSCSHDAETLSHVTSVN